MIGSVLIISISLVLLVYWFRYTCILLLQNRATNKFEGSVAAANRLSYPSVQRLLEAGSPVDLNGAVEAIDQDYRLLTYLGKHAAGMGMSAFEQHLLRLDYLVLRIFYRLARNLTPLKAASAVREMASILSYFAGVMGEQLASTES